MHSFKLKILTPHEKLFDGLAISVKVKTESGEITVLKNHTPLISILSIGGLKIVDDKNIEHSFMLQGGVLDIKSKDQASEVVILADYKLDINNLNENLDAEIERAKQAMSQNKDEIDFAELESELERSVYLKRFLKK